MEKVFVIGSSTGLEAMYLNDALANGAEILSQTAVADCVVFVLRIPSRDGNEVAVEN